MQPLTLTRLPTFAQTLTFGAGGGGGGGAVYSGAGSSSGMGA